MNKVYVMSDIHGKWQYVRDFILRNKIKEKFTKEDTLILLGDTGANFFFNHRDEEFKEKLEKMPITFFIIRGNHEERPSICMEKNPNEWHTETYFRNTVYVENKYPSIKYAMDEPTLYQIPYLTDYSDGTPENDYNDEGEPIYKYFSTLVIPGAYSVDKYYRLQNGWSWFEHEQLTKEEMDKVWMLVDFLNATGGCDLVLSHTCPCIFEPTDLFHSFVDQAMVDKTMERYLGQIEFALNYKAWLWGHYHEFRDYPRTDNKKKTMLFNNYAINLIDYMLSDIKDEVIKL